MDNDDCMFVSLHAEDIGLKVLIENWKNRFGWDARQYAEQVLSRARLRKQLWLLDAFLFALAYEVLFYGLEAQKGYGWIWIAGLLATLVIFCIPKSTNGFYNSIQSAAFMLALGTIGSYCRTDRSSVAQWPPHNIELRVEDALVGFAIKVRELEENNKTVPQEHWKDSKLKFVIKMEKLYDAASKFGLVTGGYGRYYAKADQLLAGTA